MSSETATFLPVKTRQVVLDYYREEGQAKIDLRRAIAERSGIGLNALRLRMHRTRSDLQVCMQKCLEHDQLL